LRRHGIEPVAFADNNARLWNSQVDGVPVLRPADAAKQFGTSAAFVISIWGARAADRTADRIAALHALGCETVVPFAPLFWRYPEGVLPHYTVDLPHKVIERSADVFAAFDLWSDEASRREYVAQLRWRLACDFAGLGEPDVASIYFPTDVVRLEPDETFVDCGAFDGDTLRQFLAVSGGAFEKYVAFEPDPENSARLRRSVEAMPAAVRDRIAIVNAAVAQTAGTVRFAAGGGPSSHVGAGNLEVNTVALDDHLGAARVTFIKMDIEGAEPDALAGAARHIGRDTPILAVSCYHRQDHLWAIPLLIQAMHGDYAFYLRPHDLEGWDLVCYAIPRSRLTAECRAELARR
jgi:FkbM family methyltransferase